jgi:predicted kinase
MMVRVCGPPSAGKSTLSAAIAELLPSLTLHVDATEGAMWKYQIAREQSGIAAFSISHPIAVPNLQRGQTVIADAVSGIEFARAGWASTANAAGGRCA